jgi:hypothetical protein
MYKGKLVQISKRQLVDSFLRNINKEGNEIQKETISWFDYVGGQK